VQSAIQKHGSLEQLIRNTAGTHAPHTAQPSHTWRSVRSAVLMRLARVSLSASLPDASAMRMCVSVLLSLSFCITLLVTQPELFGLADAFPVVPANGSKTPDGVVTSALDTQCLAALRQTRSTYGSLALIGVCVSLTAFLLTSLLGIALYGTARVERLLYAASIHLVIVLQHGTVLAGGERYYAGAFGNPISVSITL
jgi:hypothetical protein